jgi:hypothetical protein
MLFKVHRGRLLVLEPTLAQIPLLVTMPFPCPESMEEAELNLALASSSSVMHIDYSAGAWTFVTVP